MKQSTANVPNSEGTRKASMPKSDGSPRSQKEGAALGESSGP
jgi:hypothetical protein